ncbi:MAG: TIGR04255 family protein [Gammaproteobacteria bacterium]|nr:TIGR04255 family protein [Gammaproteobacteria bacterium]
MKFGAIIRNIMQGWEPIRENNAIDEIAIKILFKSDICGNSLIKKLIETPSEIITFLPENEIISTLGVNFNSRKGVNQSFAQPPGVIFYRMSLENQDRRVWMLRVDANCITVACREYVSWKLFSKQSLSLLNVALSNIDMSVNPATDITLHCVDKFLNQTTQNLAKEILNDTSSFFSNHIIEQIIPWKIQQRWFQEIPKISTLFLHSLDISIEPSTTATEGGTQEGSELVLNHAVLARNSEKIEFSDKVKLFGIDGRDGYLAQVFQTAHDMNKDIVRQILNTKMAQRIGIDSTHLQ